MTNLVNEMVVRDLTKEFGDVDAMLVVSLFGLDVPESESLRSSLAERGVKFRMVRNKLTRRVLAERGIEFAAETFLGNTAIAYGDAESAIGAAKVFGAKEIKKAGKVTIKAGLLDGEVLDASSAAQLADIPDRDTLRAQLLSAISGPARALASVISAVPSATVRVIDARVEQGEGAST